MEHGDRFDEKLEEILRRAAVVFAEKGFDRASVRDIAAATGVSLSGLYYYFKSKDELLFLLQRHCFDTLVARVHAALNGVEEPEAQLRIVVEEHLRFFAANMAEMKVLSHEDEALSPEFRAQVDERKRAYSRTVEDIVRDLLPPDSPIDARVATFSLFGMMNWIYTWYRPEGDVTVADLQRQVFRLFLAGVRGARAGGADRSDLASSEAGGDHAPSMWGSPDPGT